MTRELGKRGRFETGSYYLVVGLGVSGKAMALFLRSKGHRVIATDIDASRTEDVKTLNKLGIDTQVGFHDLDTFKNAAVIVPSPGIPLDTLYIKAAMENKVPITGELDIFSQYCDLPMIAITGTNGKTTTTRLVGEMLKYSRFKPFVGGNIAPPLVNYLMDQKNGAAVEKADVIVAEISSFQLDLATSFKPEVGVLLNISADHLDRYNNYQAYEKSKWRLFDNQIDSQKAVINRSIHNFEDTVSSLVSQISTFSSQMKNDDDRSAHVHPEGITITLDGIVYEITANHLKNLHGIHNWENAAAAALAILNIRADFACVLKGLESFKPLSHRVEFVKKIKGISYFNDSKATNIDAVIQAVSSLKNNIILILGGREKNTGFSELLPYLKPKVKQIVALGETKDIIRKLFEGTCPVTTVHTMKEAVETTFEQAEKNDTVLLSPACASFDMYENYKERGNDFKRCVERLEP